MMNAVSILVVRWISAITRLNLF